MKRPFIILNEVLAIVFFVIGLYITLQLLEYTKPSSQKNHIEKAIPADQMQSE